MGGYPPSKVTITLNRNDDEVMITEITPAGKEQVLSYPCHNFSFFQDVITAVLNLVNPESEVVLEEINEDSRREIDSW